MNKQTSPRAAIVAAKEALRDAFYAGAEHGFASAQGQEAYNAALKKVEALGSEYTVADAGNAFGKVAVAERDLAEERLRATKAALASTQEALVAMERDRDAWKTAAGVDYRDLDTSPSEVSARRERLERAIAGVLRGTQDSQETLPELAELAEWGNPR